MNPKSLARSGPSPTTLRDTCWPVPAALDVRRPVHHTFPKRDALPRSGGMVHSNQRRGGRRVGESQPAKVTPAERLSAGPGCSRHPRSSPSRSGARLRWISCWCRDWRGRAAAAGGLVGPVCFDGARGLLAMDAVAGGQEVRLEAVVAGGDQRAGAKITGAAVFERNLGHNVHAPTSIRGSSWGRGGRSRRGPLPAWGPGAVVRKVWWEIVRISKGGRVLRRCRRQARIPT